ncbi:MAG: glycoside hydrolase family 130 protein [Deltaproteobacteria bacterium]|nr:glycoside hydrolase family 130 protein [Deltaproteobacteria bacterium]MBW2069423.1 glycoside hydrolase family 130 protein [Deltaproteobacteria bacterium]
MEREDIFQRHPKNPILTRDDVPYHCNTVFNAAVCRFKDTYMMLLRVEETNGRSHLTLAESQDGIHFSVHPRPWIVPSEDPEYEPYERFGIEDPRITQIGETYYITYVAFGPHGPRTGLGLTKDFKRFERICLMTESDNKDCVLFPEKIQGYYVRLDRPGGMGGSRASIWISYSPDLIHWGRSKVLLAPEPGWGASKVGVSTPPIKTEEGWLVLYHGVRQTGAGRIYRVGAMLLDLEKPEKLIRYTPHFILAPREYYERVGDVPNVVFPCGFVLEENVLKLYYGAADTCICLAETTLDEIMKECTGKPNNI